MLSYFQNIKVNLFVLGGNNESMFLTLFQAGKEEKIRLALEKMKQANVKKLFIKAFTSDGSAKSLLVDESMTCGYVTRLLADKNHLAVDPRYGLVEHIPDLHMGK